MKVKKLNESTSAKLKIKANGDYLVANEEGDGYSAYTKEDEYMGHLSAKDDAEAVDNFSQVQPKLESTNEDYLNSAEFRIQRYEDEIPELFHKVHDGYMSGMVNAKAYADALARIHSALEELNYIDESLTEGYMDAAETVEDTSELIAVLKLIVKEYDHMMLMSPVICRLHDDEHGRRLELSSNMNESMPDPELDTSLSTNETSMEVQDNIGNTKEPNKQFNENTVTNNLPEHLDNFLMDIAQEFGEISYLDISLFGKVATDVDLIKLNELRALYLEEAEYDDPKSLDPIVDDVVKLVKSCCEDSKQLNEEDIAEDDLQHEEGDEDSEAVDMNEEYDDNYDDLSSFKNYQEVSLLESLYLGK